MKKKKENRLIKFLYNPWVVGAAFYLLGLLTPKTVATVKEFSLIKKEVHNIDVVGNMYVNQSTGNNLPFFFIFLATFIFLVFILVVYLFNNEE